MRLIEFRIRLPFTVDEYQLGQLWTVAEGSKAESGGGDGVQILANTAFSGQPQFDGRYDSGQYTKKVYHFRQKAGAVARRLFDRTAFQATEEAWNAYPFSKTVVGNTAYFNEDFRVEILSMHTEGGEAEENVFMLDEADLRLRKVVELDIASDKTLKKADINEHTAVDRFKSTKTGRGPLTDGWPQRMQPIMMAYKMVRIKFTKFGLSKVVEGILADSYPRIFTVFHRKCFCWMDKWHGLTMENIRQFEQETARWLDEHRNSGAVQGMVND